MQTIWKFPLRVTDTQTVMMPYGARILCVQTQPDGEDSTVCLWATVYPQARMVERRIYMFGTGHPMPTQHPVPPQYIGTFQLSQGALVFHVFAGGGEPSHTADAEMEREARERGFRP